MPRSDSIIALGVVHRNMLRSANTRIVCWKVSKHRTERQLEIESYARSDDIAAWQGVAGGSLNGYLRVRP